MEIKWIEENGISWAADDRGNKCSVAYFGGKEEAEKALRSLFDCAHLYDAPDIEALKARGENTKYLEEVQNDFGRDGIVRTEAFVTNECKSIIDQLCAE